MRRSTSRIHRAVVRFTFFQGRFLRRHSAVYRCGAPTQAIFFLFFFNLTYSRWTSSLPSCLWSQRIFPSFPGSRLTKFFRDASSALLQLVNQWLNFTYSRSHAFHYERKNTNPTLVRIELTTSVLADVQLRALTNAFYFS